ncbi:MAG TPA: hypothetical protein VGH14_09320 [Solirubrobacterales bacterium]|jgi:hypothetical protein
MPATLRVTVIVGMVLVFAQLSLRQIRSREVRLEDLFEAIVLALGPVVLPGAAEMIVKALGGDTLPIFNTAEDRLALIIGGAAVIAAITQVTLMALRRAWDGKRA